MNLTEAIATTLDHLSEAAEFQKKTKATHNIHSPIAEISFGDNKYQVQLSFIRDKKLWINDEDGIQFSEVTKLHND